MTITTLNKGLAIKAVIASLALIFIIILLITTIPHQIGLLLEKRRKTALEKKRISNLDSLSSIPHSQSQSQSRFSFSHPQHQRQSHSDRDIEMGILGTLPYPDPAVTRRRVERLVESGDDWPLRSGSGKGSESVTVGARERPLERECIFEDVDLGYEGPVGKLEGFPYYIC